MKKNTILILGVILSLTRGVSFADCQEMNLGAGKSLCLDIIKTSNDFFRLQINQQKGNLTDLHCELILPNDDLVRFNGCQGDFRYSGNERKLQISSYLSDQYATLITNYDFSKGKFESDKSESHSSTSSYQYSNYQVTFPSISNERLEKNERVDLTLRVRNTGTSQQYFDGVIEFEVQEWRDGRWKEAYSSDYQLDRTTYRFSQSEQGEAELTKLLRFSTQGEFRLLAKIRDSESRSSQTFYVNQSEYRRYSSSYRYYDEYDSRYSNNLNYSTHEYEKLRAVANIWDSIISKLRSDYPKLRNSSEWQRRSNDFSNNMQEVLRGKRRATFSSRSVFYKAFIEWLGYTIQTR